MGRLLAGIGIVLLVLGATALGLYAWYGHWGAICLALAALFLGKTALGLVELLVLPLAAPSLYFARRGSKIASIAFFALATLVTRVAYAGYCSFLFVYLVRLPGPPLLAGMALSAVVAGAPFHWAAQHATEEQGPNMDLTAALVGSLASGVLLAAGLAQPACLAPIALLFAISGVVRVAWWVTTGLPRAWIEAGYHDREGAGQASSKHALALSISSDSFQPIHQIVGEPLDESTYTLKALLQEHFGMDLPVGPGSAKRDDPLIITDQRDYVALEYAIANFLLQEMQLESRFEGQQLHRPNGRAVDELVYATKPVGERDWNQTRRFFFDITAGFDGSSRSLDAQ